MTSSRPNVFDRIVLEWRCGRRTRCCRSWRVDVLAAGLREMALRCSEAGDGQAAIRLMREHPDERRLDGACALPMNEDGACMFLDGDSCTYRVKYGAETLPDSCAKFPYLALLTPQRNLYGLSFTCPTALQLLAGQRQLELVEDHAGSPPTDIACDFQGEASGQQGAGAAAFWEAHWEWFQFIRACEGPPALRLKALAEQAAGLQLPVLQLGASFWAAPQWDRAVGKPLVRAGASEDVLQAVYDDNRSLGRSHEMDAALDGDDLLELYLEHRLLTPEFLIAGASLARLLGVLFAAVARFRIERARGREPLDAIANLDRLLIHSDFVSGLFPPHIEESVAWPSLALLALAR